MDPSCLAEVDRLWRVAGLAAREPMSLERLARACDAHQALIACLERIHRDAPGLRAEYEVRANSEATSLRTRRAYLIVGALIIPVNFFVFLVPHLFPLFVVLAIVQFFCGLVAFTSLWRAKYSVARGTGIGGMGVLVMVGAVLGTYIAWITQNIGAGNWMGGAWGRPLRLRGRVLHPNLREGADWTRGEAPDVTALDPATRAALEALWLHDAQKEYASVPALARVTWLLAAVGAPADLVEGVHVAAMEEIEHTRLCFALAAGYGGRSHTATPMPDLLSGGLDVSGDPWERIAIESLNDGCLLEDFNADVAALCASACRDGVTRGVLARIAREERSHAELSWRLLAFALDRGGAPVKRIVERAVAKLDRTPRPTAASSVTRGLVEKADAHAMRAHGRLPDSEWAHSWRARLEATRLRARSLLSSRPAPNPSLELATTGA